PDPSQLPFVNMATPFSLVPGNPGSVPCSSTLVTTTGAAPGMTSVARVDTMAKHLAQNRQPPSLIGSSPGLWAITKLKPAPACAPPSDGQTPPLIAPLFQNSPEHLTQKCQSDWWVPSPAMSWRNLRSLLLFIPSCGCKSAGHMPPVCCPLFQNK